VALREKKNEFNPIIFCSKTLGILSRDNHRGADGGISHRRKAKETFDLKSKGKRERSTTAVAQFSAGEIMTRRGGERISTGVDMSFYSLYPF